jgi:hypothetical protein
VELGWGVAKQLLKVTHKAVHVPVNKKILNVELAEFQTNYFNAVF